MIADRFELTGTGAAVLFHAALIAALSMSLARVTPSPEPPAMSVELVDEIGLASAAPAQTPSTPPPSQAPDPGEADPQAAPSPAPAAPLASARPSAIPTPQVDAAERRQRAIDARRPPRAAPRASRLGDDFLKGIAGADPSDEPARPSAPAFSARARASVASAIASQAQRCADRQPYLGDGADEIRVGVKLFFARSGRLSRPPLITAMNGPAEPRAKYGDLLEDQVRRIFADCAPFRLPAELYDTDDGGWKETTLTYRVKK